MSEYREIIQNLNRKNFRQDRKIYWMQKRIDSQQQEIERLKQEAGKILGVCRWWQDIVCDICCECGGPLDWTNVQYYHEDGERPLCRECSYWIYGNDGELS